MRNLKMKNVIAITGYTGSGKDTAADIVQALIPNAIKITFATKLKSVLSQVFGIHEGYFYDRILKEREYEDPIFLSPQNIDATLRLYSIEADYQDFKQFIGHMIYSPRELMEFMGTNVLQSFDKQIHAKAEIQMAPKAETYIVTDLRFIHEYEFLLEKSEHLQILYIDNDLAKQNAILRKSIAEIEISKIIKKAIYVDNNGTLEALQNNISKHIGT